MMLRQNSVVFLGAFPDACCLWRLYVPHLSMPGSSFYCFARKIDYNVVTGYDVCVVQRCCLAQQFDFLKLAAQLGMKIVYDIDDNVWEIPEYNPAYQTLTQHRDGFKACIRMVDVVSVSTKALAKAVRKHVKFMVSMRTGREIPIIVAENRIDERMFVPPVTSEVTIVGWAGSSSHIGDLDLIEDAIRNCATQFPQVQFQFRGCGLPATSQLPKLPNFDFKLWMPVAEYGCRMPLWGWSISLAPVIDNEFNSAKSNIKMVEAGYCGIPCLASAVRPYDEFVSHDPELRWLLCSGYAGWARKLKDLLHDKARREELGLRMRDVVRRHYSMDKPHEGWEEVFKAAYSQGRQMMRQRTPVDDAIENVTGVRR
jgi:glycosyltransferase involved in cell wall biosynthesis